MDRIHVLAKTLDYLSCAWAYSRSETCSNKQNEDRPLTLWSSHFGRGGKVVNDPSVPAIPVIPVCLLWKNKAMGTHLPYPGQYISESVHAYIPMVTTVLGSVFRVLWRLLGGECGVVE